MNHHEFTARRLLLRAERAKQTVLPIVLIVAAFIAAPDEAAHNLTGAALLVAIGAILATAFDTK
jgi:hypothetical protein